MTNTLPHYLKISNARSFSKTRDKLLYRSFEILPGCLAWGSLALLIWLSFYRPVWAALFILVFDFYWLLRIAYFYAHLAVAFRRMRQIQKIDWLKKMQNLSDAQITEPKITWDRVYHLVILPFYNEHSDIIHVSLDALANSAYPVREKIIVILAAEERAGTHAKEIAQQMTRQFSNKFFRLLTTFHPQNIPGELAGKGANLNWTGHKSKELLAQLDIPYNHVMVSTFDIDTVVPAQYFSRLTYLYLTTPNRLRASYQPVPLYINNVWEAPPFSRIAAFSTTFWMLINQERQEKLKTFSSHSMPFQAAYDVDFWKKDMVTEDNIIFFQCFLRYDGDYRVVPLHLPVYMDANLAENNWQTAKNVYKQHRRWGWGVETIPFMLYGFLKNKRIALKKKFELAFDYIEGFWSWSTNSLIIALLGWLPGAAGGDVFRQNVLALNISDITSILLNLSLIFLIFSVYFSITLLPQRPQNAHRGNILSMAVQWLLMPLAMISFISLPALDAQTRLMLGKYMGFWVTPKNRKLQ